RSALILNALDYVTNDKHGCRTHHHRTFFGHQVPPATGINAPQNKNSIYVASWPITTDIALEPNVGFPRLRALNLAAGRPSRRGRARAKATRCRCRLHGPNPLAR